ncbi:prepilin peptidase [Glaciimonas sp. PCH181]|uniref:A24 family peptidase n=1 Tax=Glaciimonas sp. PCH181 TaxID=2133943 RepID=UPI000D354A94|nr:prepilin peptidase [Glaciimonas sp. PCH181]PUA19813.1 prepilin peptidase [Glaciimonas sp. PCH181]
MQDIRLWSFALFVLWCVAIFLYDALIRRVPNKLLVMAIAVQLCCFIVLGYGVVGTRPVDGLTGFAGGMIFFLPLYALRAMAAGDVKFFAVLGLLLGPTVLLPIFLLGSMCAGVYALVFYVSKSGAAPILEIVAMRLHSLPFYRQILIKRGARIGIPYAAYLAFAAVVVETLKLMEVRYT